MVQSLSLKGHPAGPQVQPRPSQFHLELALVYEKSCMYRGYWLRHAFMQRDNRKVPKKYQFLIAKSLMQAAYCHFHSVRNRSRGEYKEMSRMQFITICLAVIGRQEGRAGQ